MQWSRRLAFVTSTSIVSLPLVSVFSRKKEDDAYGFYFFRSMHAFWPRKMTTTSVQSLSTEQEAKPLPSLTSSPTTPTMVAECCKEKCPGRIASVARTVSDSVVCIRVEMEMIVKTGLFQREHQLLVTMGSGFCVDASGLFLTNAHVVSDVTLGGTTRLSVTTHDGRTYPAVLHSMDPWSDFAVIRVLANEKPQEPREPQEPQERGAAVARKWTPVRFAPPKQIELGEWVFTFGHPLGLAHSLTSGIVSSLVRKNADIDMAGKMDPRLEYIQTNFSGLDFGNSGGAVFNMNGEVVAIAVIKSTTDGISFAARIDSAQSLIQQLLQQGRVRRPWLGVRLLTLQPSIVDDIQRACNLDPLQQQETSSLLILEDAVEQKENVESSALIPTSSNVAKWLGKVSLLIANHDASSPPPSSRSPPPSSSSSSSLTTSPAAVQDVPESEQALMHLFKAGHTQGLLVLSVFQPSPASRADLQPGDIVTHVQGKPVHSTRDFFAHISGRIQEEVRLTLHRATVPLGGVETRTVLLRPEELDLFEHALGPLNSGDHQATYEAYLESLDEEKRAILRFLS